MSFVCVCGAAYKHNSGLYKHKRKCKEALAADDDDDDDSSHGSGEESDEDAVNGSGAGKFCCSMSASHLSSCDSYNSSDLFPFSPTLQDW